MKSANHQPSNEPQMNNWKKNIFLFLGSQTISLFGSSLVQYAIMWHITLSTQSGMMMTLYILCGFLPTFILSPFAGVWADRYNRKTLIILADGLIAISTLILAILFLMGYGSLWLLFVIAAIRALGSGIHTPAVGAILPQLVPEEHLTKINGINSSIQAIMILISPMVSAALLTMASMEVIFFVDVVTAAIAIFILFAFLHISVHKKAMEKQTTSYLSDLKLGFIYIKNNAFVYQFFIFLAFLFIMFAPVAFLTPLQVTRSFGDDVWRLTAIEIVFSIGMMLGGALIASWGGFRNRVHTMIFGILISGATSIGLGIVPNFWIYLVFMGICGIGMPIMNTPSTVILQEKVEGDYLGRVFGVLGMISTSMMPLGMLIFGPLADFVNIETLLLIAGILLIVVGLLMTRNRTLIEAGKPLSKETNPN